MNPELHAATVERLQGAVPRDGAHRIANIIIEQLYTAPPALVRRSRLVKMAELPRWMRRREQTDEHRRRLRLFSMSLLDNLRQQSGATFQLRNRLRRKNRKSNSN
jgi:hypothetical protein